jgi:hypothetical protein
MKMENKNTTNFLKTEIEKWITDTPGSIEQEFINTENSWLSCFRSQLSILNYRLQEAQKNGLTSKDKKQLIENDLESLNKEVLEIKSSYTGNPNSEILNKEVSELRRRHDINEIDDEKLHIEYSELKNKYGDKTFPSDEVKKKLLESLQNLQRKLLS